MKVLVVDDSEIIRKRLKMMLADIKNVGPISEASSYTEAMEAMSTSLPDIMILDINMPGKNGLDVLLETESMLKPPLVIMMSNYSDSYYRDLCKKMGADYFLDKTTEFEKIPEVLDQLIRVKY